MVTRDLTAGRYAVTGAGSLESARGSAHLAPGGVALTGEQDINGQPFSAASMAAAELAHTSWNGGTWNGLWTGAKIA